MPPTKPTYPSELRQRIEDLTSTPNLENMFPSEISKYVFSAVLIIYLG
jgi:hypothetical protein